MHKITKITVHVTATADTATVEAIRRMHKAQGWTDIGYHFLINKFGTVFNGRPVEKVGAHVAGHNTGNIGIALITRGSDTESNAPYGKYMTEAQARSLEKLCAKLMKQYGLKITDLYGHNDFTSAKACPCFKVRKSKEFLENVLKEFCELDRKHPELNDDIPMQAESVDGEDADVTGEPKRALKEGEKK